MNELLGPPPKSTQNEPANNITPAGSERFSWKQAANGIFISSGGTVVGGTFGIFLTAGLINLPPLSSVSPETLMAVLGIKGMLLGSFIAFELGKKNPH
jgi:hypothetical protein